MSDSERQRHDDMVRRVQIDGRWIWVYLLLEFQSEPDRFMAIRMMVYIGLLAQHLIREGQLKEQDLPPILPIVLYNGQAIWRAPSNCAECFAPSPLGLEPYRPQVIYYLVDEARLKLPPVGAVRYFSEALFRLEQGRTPSDIRQVLQGLDALLQATELQSLRRAFGVWVKSLLRRKAPPSSVDEINQINDIMEADSMLAERIDSWFEDAWNRGMQRGEALVLSRQLRLRFGALPDSVEQKLASASIDQLEHWAEAVLTAPNLEAVFETRPQT